MLQCRLCTMFDYWFRRPTTNQELTIGAISESLSKDTNQTTRLRFRYNLGLEISPQSIQTGNLL